MRYDSYCKALLILVAASIWLQPTLSNAQTPAASDLPALIVLVRHADRASEPPDNPPLTAAGIQRAKDLAAALSNTKFSAIITTQLTRTRDTAQPVAAALGLTPEVVTYNPAERDAHIKALAAALRKHAAGSVLVVSHSNLTSAIIASLGGPRLPNICETVYDHMFVLVPTAGKIQMMNSRYGAASPPPGPDCM
jgi:phosphohistidine phosphatase SixA